MRVGKNVEVGERAGRDEVQSCGVIGIGFAGETCNDVGSDGGIGQAITDEFDAAGVVLGAIPAMHGGEDAVGSGLQRQMEIRVDAMVRSEEVSDLLGDVERLNRADA